MAETTSKKVTGKSSSQHSTPLREYKAHSKHTTSMRSIDAAEGRKVRKAEQKGKYVGFIENIRRKANNKRALADAQLKHDIGEPKRKAAEKKLAKDRKFQLDMKRIEAGGDTALREAKVKIATAAHSWKTPAVAAAALYLAGRQQDNQGIDLGLKDVGETPEGA